MERKGESMGTWAVDAFGNDDALDWTYELEKFNDLSLVESTLEKVLETRSDYLEAFDAVQALAAIEEVARSQGNWGERNSYSQKVDKWVEKVERKPSMELVQKAHRAIERILAEQSELVELWKESNDYEAWYASVQELQSRIHA
jgi:hypothetical protein